MSKYTGPDEILEPTVDQFVEFMKFIANNNLWDKAKARLAQQDIHVVPMPRRQIEAFRTFVTETLLEGREKRKLERVSAMQARCGCPGPGPGPTTPHQPPPPWQDPGPWQ
jgi:hypothetical protein